MREAIPAIGLLVMITPETARSYAIFVKQYARNGEITAVNRPILQRQQTQLKLTSAEAEAIERRVLQLLAQAGSANRSGEPVSSLPVSSLPVSSLKANSASASAALTPDAVINPAQLPRETRPVEPQPNSEPEAQDYQAQLKRYEQEFTQAIALGLPFSQSVQDRLVRLQHSLKLQGNDIAVIEDQVLSRHLTQLPTPPSPLNLEQGLDQTEPVDSPPTLIVPGGTAYAQMAPTATPTESASFISTQEIPPELPPTEPPTEPPIAPLAKSVDAEPINLRSEKGIDYTTLRDLLKQQKWLDADRETLVVMLKATDRAAAGWLNADALTQLPCLDLHTIDRLWSYYSGGKFGFTAQWRAYPIPKRSRTSFSNNLPSRVVQDQVLDFARKMEWWTDRLEFLKYYNQLNFSLEAPQGHLPALWFWTVPWWKALQNGGFGSSRGGCSVDNQTLPTFMARLRMCSFE